MLNPRQSYLDPATFPLSERLLSAAGLPAPQYIFLRIANRDCRTRFQLPAAHPAHRSAALSRNTRALISNLSSSGFPPAQILTILRKADLDIALCYSSGETATM
jgi:hypothetical protein